MTARIAIADERPNDIGRWRPIWRDRGKLCAGAQYGAQRRIEARIAHAATEETDQ
jgi:hypothetical protein